MIKRLMAGLLVTAVLACAGKEERRAGEFTVEWIGSDTGGLNARPMAVWCPGDSLFTIKAMKGEDGVGLLILPVAEPVPGNYPVFDPQLDTLRPRPGVAFASRWVDDKTVAAYQSDSGSLTISKEATGLAGTFGVRMRGVNTSDTVRMTGHFGGLTPETCPAPASPPKAPRQ